MIIFGAGKLIAIPTNLADGTPITNPTPVELGQLQDIALDMSVDMKTLYGSRQYPIAVAQGRGKIDLKAKYADITGSVLGSLFFGKAPSAGIKAAVLDFSAVIPGTPFTITVTPPNSGTYVANLGVTLNGVPMTRVASAPTAGQYSLSGAVYTFNTADAAKTVLISYEYSATSTSAQFFNMTNELMGFTPSFSVLLQDSYDGRTLVVKLNRAVSSKLNIPMKSDDFAVYDFEASAFADAAGNIGYISFI